MRVRINPRKELLLELQKDGHRSLLYRTMLPSGKEMFIEETDLPDCSRVQSSEDGYPVHFSMKDAWAAITRYTSSEGLVRRQVWHQGDAEWLGLAPTFIHADLRPLVQRSLAKATHDAALNHSVTESIGLWLRSLTADNARFDHGIFNQQNTYRHAS